MACTFSSFASGGMAHPCARMNPLGPTSLIEPLGVRAHLLGRAQGEHARRHVAQEAHVVAQDLLGFEDVGHAVEREHARGRGQLLEALEVAIPVGVEVQDGDDPLGGDAR